MAAHRRGEDHLGGVLQTDVVFSLPSIKIVFAFILLAADRTKKSCKCTVSASVSPMFFYQFVEI